MLLIELKNRKLQLESYLRICESYLAKAPTGRLLIKNSRGYKSYYLVRKDKPGKALLSKQRDMDLIKGLAQKEYYEKAIVEINNELRLVNKLIEFEKKQMVQKVLLKMTESKWEFIKPIEETLENRRAKFEALEAPPLVIEEDRDDYNPHVTLKGEHVRSAAEKNIANALFRAGIPYKYEFPFRTADQRRLYPDFTIFNPSTGEIFRWEHLGMMERPKYVRDQMDKMESYYASNLFTGNGLIITFSDSYQRIDPNLIERIIQTVLK